MEAMADEDATAVVVVEEEGIEATLCFTSMNENFLREREVMQEIGRWVGCLKDTSLMVVSRSCQCFACQFYKVVAISFYLVVRSILMCCRTAVVADSGRM